MCFLIPGNPDSECGHPICQNLSSSLNRQGYLDNTSLNPQNRVIIPRESFSNLGQTQSHPSLTSHGLDFRSNVTLPPPTRSTSNRRDLLADEENELSLMRKKVKIEGNNPEYQGKTVPLDAFVPAYSNLNQSILAQNFPLINNNIGNNLLLQNQHTGENMLNSNPMLLSILQNSALLQNSQTDLQRIPFQSFPETSQAVRTRDEAMRQVFQIVNRDDEEEKTSDSFDEFFMNLQKKALTFLSNQTKLVTDLQAKSEQANETLASLINEVSSLKEIIQKSPPQDTNLSSKTSITQQQINTAKESITSEDLLEFLCGQKSDFEYQIVLTYELSLPLYKERNFEITVSLVDNKGRPVENSNKIPLMLSLYSCENPPKYLDLNTSGNKIFKGFTEKDLAKGTVGFDKIQIKEVTSHFRNGWVFLVIHPKKNCVPSSNVYIASGGVNIQPEKIKPLILEKIVVKAKKAKEKDNDD